MSAIELFLAIAFGLPICVALCCLFFAITYYQVVDQMKPTKEDKSQGSNRTQELSKEEENDLLYTRKNNL